MHIYFPFPSPSVFLSLSLSLSLALCVISLSLLSLSPRYILEQEEEFIHGECFGRQEEDGQDHEGGRQHVQSEAPGAGHERAAEPCRLQPPRVRGGEAARRRGEAARPGRPAQAGEALLPRRAPPAAGRCRPTRPQEGQVRGAPPRRQGAPREPHAQPPHHVRPLRRDQEVPAVGGDDGGRRRGDHQGRGGAPPHAPAQGAGGEAHPGEQGSGRGRREDHGALRPQGRRRRRHRRRPEDAGIDVSGSDDDCSEAEAYKVRGDAGRDHFLVHNASMHPPSSNCMACMPSLYIVKAVQAKETRLRQMEREINLQVVGMSHILKTRNLIGRGLKKELGDLNMRSCSWLPIHPWLYIFA